MQTSYKLFYLLIFLRIILPPITFKFIHPFYGMLIDEIVIDGIIAPHHLFVKYIPKKFLREDIRKPITDIPLDTYGFLWSLYPVLDKNHKYYNIFSFNDNHKYRNFILLLFCYRMIGIILYYILGYDIRILTLFPNFYLSTYIVISGCNLFKITKEKTINLLIVVGMFIIYIRELYLAYINNKKMNIFINNK